MTLRKWLRGIALTLLTIAVAICVTWWLARPAGPGSFYVSPDVMPPQVGALIRREPFNVDLPEGSRAWRILYSTTTAGGDPVTASAIVVTRGEPGHSRHPMIAWAHGTTGAVAGCGPSQLSRPFANLPALEALLAQGWILVATDYAGQGTVAPNPYLIGLGEAYSVLDSVRAARHLLAAEFDGKVVIWGHSQGGHAALWAGSVARSYAPDVHVVAVAAVSPATDLPGLLEAAQYTPVGRIMSSFVLQSYGAHYRGSGFDDYTAGWRRLLSQDMAARCLAGKGALFSVAESAMVGRTIFQASPLQGELGRRLDENIPRQLGSAPLLILQGRRDDIVLPRIQSEFIRRRCESGFAIEAHWFGADDHLSIVGAGSRAPGMLVDWTKARLAETAWPAQCTETTH